MAQEKKPGKAKARKPTAKRATTRSTAGPGFNFEDKVAAWLLTKMLRGEPMPGINVAGDQLQMQTDSLGWDIDDILASGGIPHLALSCKSNVQVTSSGLPADFVSAAWRLRRKAEPMRHGSDSLALVTRGLNAAFDATWSDIKTWCADSDAAFALAKINASEKHKKVFASVKGPGGKSSSDEDTVALIRHLQVLPLDFQLVPSHTEQNAITHCREILRSGTLEDAGKLWQELLRTAENARLRGGTICLSDLWADLRNVFDLKGHPDFSASWQALAGLTSDYKNSIETCLPGGFQIARSEDITAFSDLVTTSAISVAHGTSGCGKSALVKSVFDSRFPAWHQLWLGPEQLDAVLSEVNRGSVGVAKPLLDVLNSTTRADNVLVIDAAERLTPDLAAKTQSFIAQLVRKDAAGNAHLWRVVIIGQTEAWADGRLPALAGAPPLPKAHEVGEATPKDVRDALRSLSSLAWLALHDEAVAVLSNLRALAWVMRAESAFGAQNVSGINSLTGIADRLWQFWTDGEARFQNLMMRLAEREASFERSFALSQMGIEDAAAFDARPQQCPLRLNARNRIEFEHDLAADWARFQHLKEIADDTAKWAALASNPLWNGAVRMLGQFLLREPAGGRTAWDIAFASVEKSKDAPLAADVLLDALCLDPLAETFLTERVELLFEDHGARLNRLLRRFHHVATVPGVPAELLKINPGLLLYFEAQYRTPILGRWLRIARFLFAQQKRVADLMSPVVAKICETWLTTTPRELAPGVPMPFRKEFAEIALATARAVQIAQGKGVMFLDDSEKPIYAAALAGAPDIPDEVAEWALEMARRRHYRKDVTAEIAAFRQQEAQKRAERLRTDEAYRKREDERRSGPAFIPSGRKLPPWPFGPKDRIEKDFRECCTHSHALTQLMGIRPHAAAEVMLATIIEDSPEESYSSTPRHDWELGLEFDHAGYPTGYWKSPFFPFLQIDSVTALKTLLQLLAFCTERWEHEWGAPDAPQTTITLNDGTRVVFKGNAEVFDWSQSNSMHTGQLNAALAALERWFCTQIDKNLDITPALNDLLRHSISVGLLGVLVNVGKYRPALFSGPLRPLLGDPDLYWWDRYRTEMLQHHFDTFSWARAGEQVFQMAKQWAFAQYRQVPLRELVRLLINSDASVAAFLADAMQSWEAPTGEKAILEFRMLIAELDRQNYTVSLDEQSGKNMIHFQYPGDLQRDVVGFQQATLPKLQALHLPSQCEKILLAPRMLTSDEAQTLAAAMDSASSDEDENTRRLARSAVASALAVKAPTWLNENPAVLQQVDDINGQAIESIGETPESFRHPSVFVGRGDLRFAAYAVMHRWMAAGNEDNKWQTQVLKLMTSRDGPALATLMHIAHANRVSLGSKWWRLLQLGLLWSGLLLLAPGFEDPATVEPRWIRWLRWLRSRKLNGTSVTADAITPVEIARRVEKLEEARWKRAQAAGKPRGRRLPVRRYSSGLDTHLLEQLFSWLLRQTPQNASVCDEQERRLLKALWSFEVWRRYEDVDDDGDVRGTPSTLAYSVLESLAALVLSTPLDEAPELWKPVLSLGADAHYSIGHFIRCFFLKNFAHQDSAAVAKHWRAMLEYALNTPNWTKGRQWFYGEQLLRQLLGFGHDTTISQVPNFRVLILGMRDLYEQWAQKHLARDEDNVAGLCGFLASDAGAPICLDGLLWLAAVLRSESSAARWHRDPTGSALVELLDVIVSRESQTVAADAKVRDALVSLAAHLVARQVPAALALQERILRMHQPISPVKRR